jgi:hypothetical protein
MQLDRNKVSVRASSRFRVQPLSDLRVSSVHVGTVDDFVTVRASTFNANQQLSTRSVQQVQYQSITNYEFQQISTTS